MYPIGKEFPLFSYRNGCFKVFQFLLSILFCKISLSLCLLNSRFQCITIISKGQGELYKYILFGLKKAFSSKSHSNIIFNNNLWIRYVFNKLCCLNKYWNRKLKAFKISFLWKITSIYFHWNRNNKCVAASFPGCFSGSSVGQRHKEGSSLPEAPESQWICFLAGLPPRVPKVFKQIICAEEVQGWAHHEHCFT